MFAGFVHVEGDTVVTHRDSYILKNVSVVSVRRPLLGPSLLLAGAFLAFGAGFYDLLYPQERAAIAGFCLLAIIGGSQIARLTLLSRDLKGSELSDAIWGSRRRLQQKRAEIVAAIRASRSGGRS